VLDRLLEDECIDFDGISATSVGAVNAMVLAYGLAVGGRVGARHARADIWRRVANLASLSPLQPTPFDRLTSNQSLETSPAFVQFDLMTRLFSPYQLNPFNINPLRSILCDTVDFDAIRNAHCPIKLFLSATNVRTGKIRVFNNEAAPTSFWRRLVYHFCSRRSKSMVSTIGMAGIWATRQSSHSSITVTAETW
jgi:NTE family protein